jgi:dipeptidase E
MRIFSAGCPLDVTDGAALDLVSFEFFPHVQARPNYLPELVVYSTKTMRPIIACPDGDGIYADQPERGCRRLIIRVKQPCAETEGDINKSFWAIA